MISIKDIARAANVSHSTVSRALRGSPRVGAVTTALIRKIAEEQGYRVSAVARGLVTRRTDSIGVVVTTVADPFVGEVVAGIEEVALAHGYSLFLANCHADPDREMRVVRSFQERRVDGILVNASRVGTLYMPVLEEMKVPIVLINNQYPGGDFAYSVRIDSLSGARLAVKHLVDLGHRRIAYLGNRYGLQADSERFVGYRQILDEADIGFQPDLVVHTEGTPEGGMSGMTRLLALPEPPTAVFCYKDLMAIGAIRGAWEGGVTVPGDVSVVGFDDLFLSSYTIPSLTTIQQPKHQMGCLAAKMLLELLSGGKPQNQLILEGRLIARQSTAPPRAARQE